MAEPINKRVYAPYLEALISPRNMTRLREAVNQNEKLDLDFDEEDLDTAGYGLLSSFINKGLLSASDDKLGFTGRGFDYRPNEDSRYYLEGYPGGFQLGGTINF